MILIKTELIRILKVLFQDVVSHLLICMSVELDKTVIALHFGTGRISAKKSRVMNYSQLIACTANHRHRYLVAKFLLPPKITSLFQIANRKIRSSLFYFGLGQQDRSEVLFFGVGIDERVILNYDRGHLRYRTQLCPHDFVY